MILANGTLTFGLTLLMLCGTGCTQYTVVGKDANNYKCFENDTPLIFHVVCIRLTTIPQLTPSNFRVVMTERLPRVRFPDNVERLFNSPANRVLSGAGPHNLFEHAEYLTKDAPKNAIRWIISTEPLVVAIGRVDPKPRDVVGVDLISIFKEGQLNSENKVVLGKTMSLVTQEDEAELVSAVYISSSHASSPQDKPIARIIRFKELESLMTVFQSKPWCERPKRDEGLRDR